MSTSKSVQLNLPPTLLPNSSVGMPMLPKQEQQRQPLPTEADAASAELFDAALKASNLTSQEVAHLLGISESMVRKMRSPNYRERVSFAQMLLLPPAFHLELHKQMNKRFGFGRAALARLIGAAEDLALVVE